MVAATNPANLVRLFKGPSHPRLKMASKSWWVVLKDLSSPLDLERVTRKMILMSIHVILDLQPAIQNAGDGTLVVDFEVDTREEDGWAETVKYSEGSQFKVYTAEEKSWIDAQAHCQTSGGQLASMKKESEQKEFEALDTRKMKQSREKYIKVDWIGARQDAKGKDWLWPDGTCGHIFPIVKGFH